MWSTTTDVAINRRAMRVMEKLPEDLQVHLYQCMEDYILTSEQGLAKTISYVDEWMGDHTARDDTQLRRRYVNEAFYSPRRANSMSKVVYAERMRSAFDRVTASGTTVPPELQGDIPRRQRWQSGKKLKLGMREEGN